MALVGSAAVPLRCGLVALLYTGPVAVEAAEVVLCPSIPLPRGDPEPLGRLVQVLALALPESGQAEGTRRKNGEGTKRWKGTTPLPSIPEEYYRIPSAKLPSPANSFLSWRPPAETAAEPTCFHTY